MERRAGDIPGLGAEEDGGPSIEVVEGADIERGHPRAPGPAVPSALPVLPLQEMVPFPDTLTPLAVGRERSMRLVNEVLSGERMLVMVASKDPEPEEPGPGRALRRRRRRRRRANAEGARRDHQDPGPGHRARSPGDYVAEEPYLIARIEPMPDVVEPSPELEALDPQRPAHLLEIIEQIPYLPEELQLAVANLDDSSALSHLIAGALRIPTEEKQELLEQVDVAQATSPAVGDPRPGARGRPARHEDPVAGPVGDRQGPARVLPARAAQGDPAGAGRGRRAAGRDQRAARADRGRRASRRTPASRPTASSAGWSGCPRRPPSTA